MWSQIPTKQLYFQMASHPDTWVNLYWYKIVAMERYHGGLVEFRVDSTEEKKFGISISGRGDYDGHGR